MIRNLLSVVVTCDTCDAPLGTNPNQSARLAEPARFPDRVAALLALDAAVTFAGWARRPNGLLCPLCAGRFACLLDGHSYAPDPWRMCACDRSIPSHRDTAPDPAGGRGCGMAWRVCGRCDHLDEHHVTDLDRPAACARTQPGGSLRQDVPTGPAPNHHEDSRENAMVEPTPAAGPVPAVTGGGAR